MQKPSLPKGTRDFNPEKTQKRDWIIKKIETNFQKYGFRKIETPTIENLSVLTGKYGDEGDQLLFKVLNSGDFAKNLDEKDLSQGAKAILPKISEKGLRYDLTVPFARYVVMNQNEITFPFKRYQIQPVWRADRPQKGRYREFYQCDVDVIGSQSIWNEVEFTLLISNIFSDLRLKDYVIKINHREVLFSLAKLTGAEGKETAFCAILDKLDKIGTEKVQDELVGVGCNREKIQQILKLIVQDSGNSERIESLKSLIPGGKGIEDIENFFTLLKVQEKADMKIELDWGLARGLSYYTGLIFEVKPTSVKMGSIVGGGRYDNLTGIFGLQGVSGIGISFGLDRIYDVLEELKLFPTEFNTSTKVLICHFDEASFEHCIPLLSKLRKEGINSDLYPEIAKIKKQVSYGNKLNIPFLITIGQNEIDEGLYSLKDMVSGFQERLPLEEIIAKLKF